MIATKPRPIAAAKGRNPTAHVRYWLADTGCGHDLVSRTHVRHVADRIKASNNPIKFNTANCNTDASEDILLRVDELDEDIEPYVLASTPAVLSIGRRCTDHGYPFTWPSGPDPLYFVSPQGKRVEMVVVDYVPYLPTKRAEHTAMTMVPTNVKRGIIAVNKTEQMPMAIPGVLALLQGDDAEAAAIPADPALLQGGAVVDVEGPEPEMVEPVDETAKERLRRIAKSAEHLRDHKPKNFYCDACQQAKMFRRPHGRVKHPGPPPTRFGEKMSADHLVSHAERSQSLRGAKMP